MSETMSTKDFLLSKESRPLLISIVVVLAFFGAIGYWTFGALFGSNEDSRPRAENFASGGSSTARAPVGSSERTDLTSETLSDEAKAAAREYNKQSEGDTKLHPMPTSDDVNYVPVEPVATKVDVAPLPEPVGLPKREDRYTYNPPASHHGAGGNAQAAEERRRREVYEKERQEAARDVLSTYAASPSIASVSFEAASAVDADKMPSATHVDLNYKNGAINPELVKGDESSAGGECKNPLVKGGEIMYVNNDIALNTDFAGPVRMTFLGGDLDRWTAMGTFELNEFGARLKPKINTVVSPAGTEYSVSGYVLDQKTTLWALASDVDYHIIYRYGGFGLATILSGFQELAQQNAVESVQTSGTGQVVNEYRTPGSQQITWTLLGSFSELWREAFRDNINRPITVTLDPNEQAAILFEGTVCKKDNDAERQWEAERRRAVEGRSDPVARS